MQGYGWAGAYISIIIKGRVKRPVLINPKEELIRLPIGRRQDPG